MTAQYIPYAFRMSMTKPLRIATDGASWAMRSRGDSKIPPSPLLSKGGGGLPALRGAQQGGDLFDKGGSGGILEEGRSYLRWDGPAWSWISRRILSTLCGVKSRYTSEGAGEPGDAWGGEMGWIDSTSDRGNSIVSLGLSMRTRSPTISTLSARMVRPSCKKIISSAEPTVGRRQKAAGRRQQAEGSSRNQNRKAET
jgi:hypothetical protein